MQHQTVPQTTVDLSHAGVDNILAALADAGLEVHYNETDGDTHLDVWLTDLDADTPIVLSWRDNQGWRLKSWDSNDTTAKPARAWSIVGVAGPGEVASETASILADDEKPMPTAGYRVAFDVMAGIEPITFPASSTAAEIAEKVTAAFAAAEVPIAVKVAVDLEGDTVTVSENGDVIEHGSITRVDEQPKPELDLRRVAYDIVLAGVAAGMPIPDMIDIPSGYDIFELKMADNDQASADAWAAYLDLPKPSFGSVIRGNRRHFRNYGAESWKYPALPGWKVEVSSYVDEPAEGGESR